MQSDAGGKLLSNEKMSFTSFKKTVWAYYRKNGRHDLPWRKSHDPYRILVSEIMLQQTQVERVIPFYAKFLSQFPTTKKLAAAPLGEVLKTWQGLGYNRRAKMLHEAAKRVVKEFGGTFPKEVEALEELPGIGPYTARAVAAFAHNEDVVFIETNIRTVITHHFFARTKSIADTEVLHILTEVFPKGKSREWYAALMDYGAYLKRSGIQLNTKSTHYSKQSRFVGSDREARGAILRELAKGSRNTVRLEALVGDDRMPQMQKQLQKLLAEGLIQKRGKGFALPR